MFLFYFIFHKGFRNKSQYATVTIIFLLSIFKCSLLKSNRVKYFFSLDSALLHTFSKVTHPLQCFCVFFFCLHTYLNVVNSYSLFPPVSHNYLTHPDFSVYLPAVYFLSENLVGIQDNIKIKIVDANFRKETHPNPAASFLSPHIPFW